MKAKGLLTLIFALKAYILIASSAFYIDHDAKLLAKNHDWKVGHGYIFKNIRGQLKFAYGWSGNNPASWTSKYGSITFNQFGKEFPSGGINEKGLVVEKLFLPNSVYPNINDSPTISDLEWIQYQLDNFATVKEVIGHINNLTIYPLESLQYMLADSTGDAVIIDFLNGKIGIHYRTQKHIVLTTESLRDSENYYRMNGEIQGKKLVSNFDRYVHLNSSLKNSYVYDELNPFELLSNIATDVEPYKTQWSVVYNLDELNLHFSSGRNPGKKFLDLRAMDFSDSTIVEIAEIHTNQFGLKHYHPDVSRILFQKSQNVRELKIDEVLLSAHFLDPGIKKIDAVFQDNYIDIVFRFIAKNPKGMLSFVLLKKDNAIQPSQRSVKAGQFLIENKETVHVIYGIPKGEVYLACFQDPGFQGNLENKILSNSNTYPFLRHSDSKSGSAPIYYDTNLYIKDEKEVIVKIK
ncbi:linear amide C-N hydrolase [Aquiflexum sp.]|uniref:linear amide C-N hydrolase n=1 Tax=Aquiflexum sp. TaxID=1872584 RepID=UPI0035933E64